MFLINQKVSEDREALGYSSMNISNGPPHEQDAEYRGDVLGGELSCLFA